MGIIYKITNNINDKIYIGQTIRPLHIRWQEHKKIANQLSNSKINSPLYCAMRKYGIDNFQIEQLEEIPNDNLNERECYWINFYDSYKNGYNATFGGNGHSSSYSVVKDKDEILKLWQQGYNITTIGKILCHRPEVVRKVLEIDFNYTSEQINQQKYLNNKKSILQIDIKTNNILYKWDSVTDAAKYINPNKVESTIIGINRVCQNKRQTAYGYKWKYL